MSEYKSHAVMVHYKGLQYSTEVHKLETIACQTECHQISNARQQEYLDALRLVIVKNHYLKWGTFSYVLLGGNFSLSHRKRDRVYRVQLQIRKEDFSLSLNLKAHNQIGAFYHGIEIPRWKSK